jgi:flagellar assembly factor FliW
MSNVIDFSTATAMEIRDGKHSAVVPLSKEVIFKFENGLPAFEDCKEFIFLMEEHIQPFVVMQSLNKENLSFVCVDPFLINSDYTVRLSESVLENLGINGPDDIMVFSVVTVNPDMTKTTANLVGPVVINVRTNKGMQVILDDIEPELVRYNVWGGITALEERENQEQNCAG